METTNILFTILIGFILGLIFIFVWLRNIYNYWKRKGVPYLKSDSYIFGNLKQVIFKKKNLYTTYEDVYQQFKHEPYCGFYEFHYPVLMIRHPHLIQTVLVEKFNSFQTSKLFVNKNADEILHYNPFILNGSVWRETRSIISTGLTQNKLRALDEMVKPFVEEMFTYIDKNSDDVEAGDLCIRFASEMVANFGWGIKSNAFSQESTIKDMFDLVNWSSALSFTLMLLNPFWSRLLNLRFYSKKFISSFKGITKQVVESMENNKTNQTTFLQNILNARDKYRSNGKDISLSEITGHMATFFLDGYDTTARTSSYLIHTLMLHPEYQRKIKEEILKLETFTVEEVAKLQYLDMFISEFFRYYPIVPFIGRVCSENCKLGNLEVEAGTPIIIPISSLHKNPDYYPNPDVFDPENFSEENKQKRHKYTHFIFGAGPRSCLGQRYALAHIKLLFCYILKRYDIVPAKSHPAEPMTPSPESVLVFVPNGPLYVGFKKTN